MGKPEIRFKGYTDEWEQRKLEDLTEELSDYATMASGLPLLTSSRSGLMYQSDFRDRKTTTSDETLFSIVPKGSCTYRHMSDDDIFHLNINVLEKGLVSREYPVFISSENNDLEFIIQHINSSNRFRTFCKGQKKGGTRTRLYYKTLCEFEMMIPSIEEQKKISAILHNLDHLITLHQRKCDEVKSLKKYMLQKMFPQNEQKVPEIRFEGFTEAWEQRKFSEGVSEIGDGLHGTPIYCEDGNVYFINGNNLVDGKIVINAETKKVNESQQSTADKSLDDTTILMSINGTIGNLAYYSGERLMLGKSAAYIKVSEFDKRFVYAYLQAPSVHGYFMDSLTGTTIKNLGLKAIREMIMFIPQDVDEQKRIGKFLDQLDHLITLHQQKCEELKKIKKFMLQKMFV